MSWNVGLKDKIGSLSHNAGVISLQPSIITIGGRQYKTNSVLTRTIATDVTLIANSLYMIYIIVVSGVAQLRISTNINSSGPSGFSAWKLAGAFYSDGQASISFGSFVNIIGKPETAFIETLLFITDQNGSSIIASAPVVRRMRWSRVGNILNCEFGYYQNAGSLGIAGIGQSYIKLPTNIPIVDTSGAYAGGNSQNVGQSAYDIGGGSGFRQGQLYGIDNVLGVTLGFIEPGGTKSFVSQTSVPMSTNLLGFAARYAIPVVSWRDQEIGSL